ncbi:STAS/SEC14 domain-containing protein [Chitinophaga sancti]|uniref:STAS/SEC14 domain-containing protein n=1 Tax=Chitinophaga sancti TaxID=1004 RepID=UPI002A74B0A6|nr:STAS/SEC14 domain-containing protein [Chitinophaga sancti]WPQ61629.1 STAS/SEC14 domain-containing protein [Chitinophaga sancti]
MIEILPAMPNNMVGFKATGEVTQDNFLNIVDPVVRELVSRTGELNYLMIIETPLKNWTMGAWLQDALLGIMEISKWNRVAIVSGSDLLNKFTDVFGMFVPGTFKGFGAEQFSEAVHWVSTGK